MHQPPRAILSPSCFYVAILCKPVAQRFPGIEDWILCYILAILASYSTPAAGKGCGVPYLPISHGQIRSSKAVAKVLEWWGLEEQARGCHRAISADLVGSLLMHDLFMLLCSFWCKHSAAGLTSLS